jgi:hypothetical protein
MKQSSIPINIYTQAPLQHPNILLGSLQLLFWLVFRPSAWKNHLWHLDLSLSEKHSLLQLLTQHRWRKKNFWRFIVQVFILLPIISSLGTGLIALRFVTLRQFLIEDMFFLPGLVHGVLSSVLFGLVSGLILGLVDGVVVALAVALAVSLVSGVAFSLVNGLVDEVLVGWIFGLVFGMMSNSKVGIGFLSGIVFGCILGLNSGLAVWIGLLVSFLRPTIMAAVFIPWHALLYRIDVQKVGYFSSLLPNHLAFWDERQRLPLWGLDKHLLLVIEKNPTEGQIAFNYLSSSSQRWAVQAVQIELDARQLEGCIDAPAIGQIQQILTIGEFSSAADTMFRTFNNVSVDVDVALRQSSIYKQRLAFTDVDSRLNNLIRELTRSSDKYAGRFRPIAQRWRNIIDIHLQSLIKESELRQEIDSPYIIGVPVINRQQLFVGRTDISKRLEKFLFDRRSPPLLLYGQRRTGKTSLLRNLGRLLPTSIIPLFVDFQGAVSSANNHTGFLYNIAKDMIKSAQSQRNFSLPPLAYETLSDDPFTRFDEWLDIIETSLGYKTVLLALDEFEVLDRVLGKGRFNENDVLDMLRNLIQHRPSFRVLFAGSHTLEEFQRFSSYLINTQVLHLGYLQESEARELIETPSENFALRYQPFASQRIIDITRCHPYLIQLLCTEVVFHKNDQGSSTRRLATLEDVEAAIPEALKSGSMFFSDIETGQLDEQALDVLRYCAKQGESTTVAITDLNRQFPDGLEKAIDLLLRRELIENLGTASYGVSIELIRRWFSE